MNLIACTSFIPTYALYIDLNNEFNSTHIIKSFICITYVFYSNRCIYVSSVNTFVACESIFKHHPFNF